MFWTSAHRLHRGPHAAVARDQIPACRQEAGAVDTAAEINRLGSTLSTIRENLCPDEIAVTLNHGMRPPDGSCFIRKASRVNAAEDHPGASLTAPPPDLVSAWRVSGADSDPDDIASLDAVRIKRKERVSSTSRGSPYSDGVAAARTCNHHGVMTAVPDES